MFNITDLKNNFTTRRSVISVLVFVFVWQLLGTFKVVNTTFIGQPILILKEGFALLSGQMIYPYILSSLQALSLGFILAILISVPAGILLGVQRNIFDYFKPYLYALNSIPKIVILPLILLWFGIGLVPKIIFIVVVASIPILINTIEGIKNVDKGLVEMAESYQVSPWLLYRELYFFSAWPFIYSGIKIAFGRSVTNLLIAEIYGLGIGLGYLVSLYGGTYQINKLLFIIALLLIFNFTFLVIFDILETRLFRDRRFPNVDK